MKMPKKITDPNDKNKKETIGNFGEFNQIYGPAIDDYIDEDSMGALDAVRRVTVTHYSDRKISPGPYRGIVLKVLKPEFSWGDIFSLWEKEIDFGPKYIVRVPELDSHIPAPTDLEATEGRDHGIIRSHNVYAPASIKIGKEEEAEVGDLVWVNVKNEEYIYLGKVKNEASTAAVGGPGDAGVPAEGDASYTAPPGGPFSAPQFAGFVKNSDAKGFFQGDLMSDYFSKVRAKNIGPPSAQTDPKLDIVRTKSFDIAPRPQLYRKSSGNYVLISRTKPSGSGFNVRQDLGWVMENLKAIINKLGGGFYGGSFYTGVQNSRKRGLSEHSIGGAIDMHLGTTYAGNPVAEEHNLEVMTNRQSWVLWLKMPNAKTIKHQGKSWSSVKKTIHAVKVGYAPGLKAPWNWKEAEGYWFNVTECFEWHSMVGLGPLGKKTWWKRPAPYKHGESWHYDHRTTHGYIPWKTTVADVIHSQSFPRYRTPAQKQKIPKMQTKLRQNVYNSGHFSNTPRGGYK